MTDIFDIFKSIESDKKENAPLGAPEFIIAFLGNPGAEYAKTRHNAGFMCADRISEKHSVTIDRVRFKALCGETVLSGRKTLLLKPQTYMNLSGESVREALGFYKLDARERLLVIYDDIYLDTGRVRIREKGSDGGHNGIKSIISNLGTDGFKRIRIGVGRPPKGFSMPDWVLGRLPEGELGAFDKALDRAASAAELIVGGDFNLAMNKYNG